jgi:hypothetical protein
LTIDTVESPPSAPPWLVKPKHYARQIRTGNYPTSAGHRSLIFGGEKLLQQRSAGDILGGLDGARRSSDAARGQGRRARRTGAPRVRFLLLITVLALVALPAQHPFDWDRNNAKFLLLIIFLALVMAARNQAIPDWDRYNARRGPWASPSADPGRARAGRDLRDGLNEDRWDRTWLVMLWAMIGMVTSVIVFPVILFPWNILNRVEVEPKKFPDVRVEEPVGEGEAVRWGATKAISGGAGSEMVLYVRHGVPIQRGALDNKPSRCALPGEPALIFGLGQSADLYRARTHRPSGGVIMCWRFVWSRTVPGDSRLP